MMSNRSGHFELRASQTDGIYTSVLVETKDSVTLFCVYSNKQKWRHYCLLQKTVAASPESQRPLYSAL